MGAYSEIDLERQDNDNPFEESSIFDCVGAENISAFAEETPAVTLSAAPAEAQPQQDTSQDPAAPIKTDDTPAQPPDDSGQTASPASDTASEDEKKKAHEAAEAKRKADWEARQKLKKADEQAQLDRLAAMSDDEVMAASMKRISTDTEKLTRRSMKECVAEYIQTMCIEDPAFARKAMHPRKSMIRCFQYINRKKELLNIRTLRATPKMLRLAAEDYEREWTTTRWGYQYTRTGYQYRLFMRCAIQGAILKVSIFLPKLLRLGARTPVYDVYIDRDARQFLTYSYEKKKWLTGKLDRLEWTQNCWNHTEQWISPADAKLVGQYFGIEIGDYWDILKFQQGVRDEQLERRHKKETEPWDADLAQVPALPKDWECWAAKVGIQENYIFYQYKRGGAKPGNYVAPVSCRLYGVSNWKSVRVLVVLPGHCPFAHRDGGLEQFIDIIVHLFSSLNSGGRLIVQPSTACRKSLPRGRLFHITLNEQN